MQDNTTAAIKLTVDSECKLTGASEILLSAIRNHLTIDNPKYVAAKRYSRWIGKKLKPKLFFFRENDNALFFPRGFANKAVALCHKLAKSEPEIIDNRRLLDPVDFHFYGNLRPYQQDAVQAVLQRSFGVLEAGTGSGKTIMALNIIANRKQPTIIVVHSKELFHQWRQRIDEFLHYTAGLAGDGVFKLKPITVAIVNTARKHMETLPAHFGHIIVDECHRVPASLFTDVVSGFDCHYMLGLSATAYRREDNTTNLIYTYMGDKIYSVELNVLTESGAIVRPEITQLETSFTYGFRGEYSKMIKSLTQNKQRNTLICSEIAKRIKAGHDGTILVVSDRVAHCEILAERLRAEDINTTVLTGLMSAEKRTQTVKEVLDGKVQVLISTLQLIGEGFDCTGLTTLVLATPIKFEGRLLQVVGRIMRPSDGKKARVIDFVDSCIPILRKSAEARLRVFNRWRI